MEKRIHSEAEITVVSLCESWPTPMAFWSGPAFHCFPNSSYAALLGLPDDARGTLVFSLLPSLREIWSASALAVMSSGKPLRLENVALPSGKRVNVSFVPVRDGKGDIIGLCQSLNDVTPAWILSEAAHPSEFEKSRLATVLELLPIGVCLCDPNGKVTNRNQAAHRIWAGKSQTESAPHAPTYKMFHPDSDTEIPERESIACLVLNQRQVVEGMLADILRWDGTRGRVMLSGAPIWDAEGNMSGAVFLVNDISELRATQLRVQDGERLRDFLAIVSHELRNPLAPLRHGLDVLRKMCSDTEDGVRIRRMMERQVGQLTRLVEDLLELSRISHGKIQFVQQPINVTDWAGDIAEDQAPLFDEAGISFRLEVPSHPVFIRADAHRLTQIAGNLLHNALKFTPKNGSVLFSVTENTASKLVQLRVKDSGRGILPEHIRLVFEPFRQVHDIQTNEEKGLGLGLSLVQSLVEKQGGSVEAFSEGLNRGAEFVVTFPLDDEKPSVDIPQQATPSDARPQLTSLRVLIIEDNPDLAEILCDVLETHGHRPTSAESGAWGLHKAQNEKFDVVLCDIGLPDVSGYDVAMAFRRDPRLSALPLVAMTGYTHVEDVLRAEHAGFSAHIAKPPAPDGILRVLRQVAVLDKKNRMISKACSFSSLQSLSVM